MKPDVRATHSHSRLAAAQAVGALLVAMALMLAASSPASAASGHPLLRSFSTGPDSWPRDLTFDAADNLYVRDTDANSAVAKYTTTGAPVPFAGSASYIQGNKLLSPEGSGGNPYGYFYSVAVDSSGGPDDGYIYATMLYGPNFVSGVQVYDASGVYQGLLDPGNNGFPCGVAVNQATGEVYTGDFVNTPDATVRRYAPPVGDPSDDAPTGVVRVPVEGYSRTCPLKADDSGNVYFNDNGWERPGEGLIKVAAGEFGAETVAFTQLSPFPDPGTGLALEPGGGFYTDRGDQVVQHSAAGAQVGSPFPTAALSDSRGVALDSSGNVYVTESPNGDGGVSVFGPTEVELPLAISGAPSSVIQVAAHATGEADPDGAGDITRCEFVYGLDAGYSGGSVPCSPAASVGSPITSKTPVSADITGLEPGTRYHYRLITGNANGAQPGSDEEFETPVAVPGTTTMPATQVEKESAELNGSFIGNGEDTHYYFEYGKTESYGSTVPASPADAGSPSGETDVAPITVTGLEGATEYHFRLVATNKYGSSRGGDQTFTTPPSIDNLTTDPPTAVTDTTAQLNGSFDADGRETKYYFEWGETREYGNKTPAPPGNLAPGTGRVHVAPVEITGLGGGFTYHYRIVASNSSGSTVGQDQVVKTAEAPIVSNINTTKLQPTSAELLGEINPRYGETTYHFEWGITKNYGHVTPDGNAGSGNEEVPVHATLEGLTEGVTYHFRLVATNQYGTTVSPDQAFGFYPPACPNAQLRQETRSNTLPDCRAYELVTPKFANGALIMSRGATGVPYNATSPSRMSYSASFALFPEETGPATNQVNDMYVSTRTDTGWTQRYVGLPPTKTASMGGPPVYFLTPLLYISISAAEVSDGAQASPDLSRFINYSLGLPVDNFTGEFSELPNGTAGRSDGSRGQWSNAPYVWNSTSGDLVSRWPTNLGEMGLKGEQFVGLPEASTDFSHFVFSSDTPFATTGPNGPDLNRDVQCCSGADFPEFLPAPIYDNDIAAQTVKLASLKADNTTQFNGYVLHTSDNGSRILMSEEWTNPSDGQGRQTFPAGWRGQMEIEGPLYLRVNGEETLEFLNGRHFNYIGSTADGKTVYIRSSEQLTPDDHDNSADLFVWHEESPDTLTRVSVGDFGNSGNEDECGGASWSGGGCSIEVTDFRAYAKLGGFLNGSGQGGNTISDQTIASESGDIYFLSPERLVAGKGEVGEANLYLYRQGEVKYVTTMKGQPTCTFLELVGGCGSSPVARMEVTPDGSHMAFITSSNVTGYDSAGHTEMYKYDPESGRVVCASCRPDGKPPVGETLGSQNGRFITEDGRVFFSETADPLVPKDTDEVEDVYEFSEGHAQLISAGTGSALTGYDGYNTQFAAGGLVGVSANGVDAYISTIDTLTSQDHNGTRYKIYDARVNGGFPAERVPPDCEAADECHGPSSTAPTLPPDRTSANLGPVKKVKHHKKRHHKRHHRKHHHKKKNKKGKRGAKSTNDKKGRTHRG